MRDTYVIKRDRISDFDSILDIYMTGSADDYELVGQYEVFKGNLYGVFLHEVGHAFDDVGAYSCSPEIQEAYDKDIATLQQMDFDEKDRLLKTQAYYLSSRTFNQAEQHSDRDAREEVCAEAFAIIIGGFKNSGNPEHAEEHKRIFANCYAVVEQKILSIAPEANLYPTHDRIYDYYRRETVQPEPRKIGFSFGEAVETSSAPTTVALLPPKPSMIGLAFGIGIGNVPLFIPIDEAGMTSKVPKMANIPTCNP